MYTQFNVGDVRITQIVEYDGPTHEPMETFRDFDETLFRQLVPLLPKDHYIPGMRKLVIAVQIWVVQFKDKVIVVDTGVGNHKSRPKARMNKLNNLTLDWLTAAGASREQVTHVVLTHLHNDHTGWCTMMENGRWVPTFPNARYIAPKKDFEFFRNEFDAGRGDVDGGSFEDSIVPVWEAGLMDFTEPGETVADFLNVADACGHTPGMINFWLTSGGESAVFCADIFHHPVQILQPDWNTIFCVLPAEAKATRHAFLEKAASSKALIMPCHFARPGCGYVVADGNRRDFSFRPFAA